MMLMMMLMMLMPLMLMMMIAIDLKDARQSEIHQAAALARKRNLNHISNACMPKASSIHQIQSDTQLHITYVLDHGQAILKLWNLNMTYE